MVGAECSLPFISLFINNPHIVVSPMDIKFDEIFHVPQLVHKFENKQK
jgi:hypothetical protein